MKLSPFVFSLLLLGPVAAIAGPAEPSMVVSYADLNLSSQAGQKVFDSRLANALRTVCHAHDGTAIAERRAAEDRCLREKGAEVAALRARAIANATEALAAR